MSSSTSILHFNLGALITCASMFLSNVKDDEEELTRILNKSADEIYLTREEQVEFFDKYRLGKFNAEKILAWSQQAAVLEIPSLNLTDFRNLILLVVDISMVVSAQLKFYEDHKMDDYLSDKNIKQNWVIAVKMERVLAEIREIVVKD